jgi:hypothetical protein
VAILLARSHEPLEMLVVGSAPQAVRTIILVFLSIIANHGRSAPKEPISGFVVIRFLAGGQIVNVVKNGATSIETMILAAFAAPQVIALYRLAKSSFGVATAASNTAVQQGFFSIAKAETIAAKFRQVRLLRLRLVRICLATYPLSCAFAGVYGMYKPDVTIISFELITFGVFLASLPTVLLQASFVVLSLEGKNGKVSIAYLLSLVVLLGISLALFVAPSVWLFLGALFASGLTRQLYLARCADALLAESSLVRSDDEPDRGLAKC